MPKGSGTELVKRQTGPGRITPEAEHRVPRGRPGSKGGRLATSGPTLSPHRKQGDPRLNQQHQGQSF